MEERDRVFDVFDVRGDVQPDAEASPLAPGGGVFLEDCQREALGIFFLCSIVVIYYLHTDRRWSICQGLLCGEFLRN